MTSKWHQIVNSAKPKSICTLQKTIMLLNEPWPSGAFCCCRFLNIVLWKLKHMKLRSCYTLTKTNDFTQSYTYSDGKKFSVCCFFVKDFIESQSEELLNVNPALWSLLHILNGCMLIFFEKMFLGIFLKFGGFLCILLMLVWLCNSLLLYFYIMCGITDFFLKCVLIIIYKDLIKSGVAVNGYQEYVRFTVIWGKLQTWTVCYGTTLMWYEACIKKVLLIFFWFTLK